jgi:NAD(P)-dependent dehydrogenase (short-subunit alcohol dehydrogenase family)
VPATIDAFAARFGDRPLHLLINNAGIMAAPLSRDSRGLESQLAVNHVGHFRLFARLLPALERAQGARVVALSSRRERVRGPEHSSRLSGRIHRHCSAGWRGRSDLDSHDQPRSAAGGPIYDVVGRTGKLVDRIQIPGGCTLIGFGPGVAYLTSREGSGVSVARARIR